MGVVVQFNYDNLVAQFPAMAPVGQTALAGFWAVAETIHGNDGSGPIGSADLQRSLMNMMTAHIAQLFAPKDPSGNPVAAGSVSLSPVGRVQSANEGSVSISLADLKGFDTAQASWLSQTQYGSMYWVATAQFRTIRYVPPPPGRYGGAIITPIKLRRG